MNDPAYREQLYEVFSEAGGDVEGSVERALDIGRAYLGMELGFRTRIVDDTQEIVSVVGPGGMKVGDTCPLDEAYCRRTIEMDKPLAVTNAVVSDAVPDAAVDRFGLASYVGTTVEVDGETIGTICFGDREERSPFSSAESTFVELFAELVGRTLERREHNRDREERIAELERERQRFWGMAENSFDILFRLDADAVFTYVSPAVERVLGYAPEELRDEPYASFLHPASVPDARAAFERVLDGKAVEAHELDFRRADGDTVTIEVNATPIESEGAVVGVQGVGRDVTARKERERELRLKDRAMDEANVGIAITDHREADEPILYVNGGFERVTGYSSEELLGRNCRFLQGDATDPEQVARLREAIENEESVVVELLNYRADGSPFWNRVQLDPVTDDGGEVTHYLGFQNDVTERKRTEQLIALLNRVLRHNLRNDMNTILGFAGFVQRNDENAAAFGGRIEKRATELIELSETARELEGYARQKRDPTRVDLAALVESVVEEYRGAFPDATVEVTLGTDADLCAGREIQRALSELVENAIKHNPADEPWVRVAAEREGEWVDLTVTDDGDGVDEMERSVIAKGEETALEHGSGLGLWLVNWVVTRYGGSFQLDAEAGEGTVARVRLPALDDGTAVEAVARRPTVLFR